MAKTNHAALAEQDVGSVGQGLLRRSLSKLLSLTLLIAIFPVSPLSDVRVVDADEAEIEQTETDRQPTKWTVAMERELVSR